jgi:hypothetical protein
MAQTIKRISTSFSKENMAQLNALMELFGENANNVIKRALQNLYNETKRERK